MIVVFTRKLEKYWYTFTIDSGLTIWDNQDNSERRSEKFLDSSSFFRGYNEKNS